MRDGYQYQHAKDAKDAKDAEPSLLREQKNLGGQLTGFRSDSPVLKCSSTGRHHTLLKIVSVLYFLVL